MNENTSQHENILMRHNLGIKLEVTLDQLQAINLEQISKGLEYKLDKITPYQSDDENPQFFSIRLARIGLIFLNGGKLVAQILAIANYKCKEEL